MGTTGPKRIDLPGSTATASSAIHVGYTPMSSSVALEGNGTAQIKYSDRRQLYDRNPNAAALSGAVSHLSLPIQVAFRRKVLGIFALQLFFVTVVVAAFEWIPSLNDAWTSALGGESTGYIAIPLVLMLVFLLALYKSRSRFPRNWVCLFLFSVALALVYAGLGAIFETSVGVINCAAIFVWVLIMIALSGVTMGKTANGDPKLLSAYVSGIAGFVVVAAVVVVLYATIGEEFVTDYGLIGTLVLQLVLSIWFAYDANKMFQVLTPDEYMNGVIYFYSDLLLILFIALVGAAGGGAMYGSTVYGSDPMAIARSNNAARIADQQA